MKKLTEADVKQYAKRELAAVGALLVFVEGSSQVGVPDALCYWPRGVLHTIEFKRPTGGLSLHQTRFIYALQLRGHDVHILYTPAAVGSYVQRYAHLHSPPASG
jgi:hypothetical protein